MESVAKTTSGEELSGEMAGQWARESLEELYFGAHDAAGSARGGLDEEGEKILAGLEHHFVETLSCIRMLEAALARALKASEETP